MAGIRFIKSRIKAATNIAQITKAMQMMAASKMKRAQERAISGKPYAEKIYQSVKQLASITDSNYHQLLMRENLTGKTLIILITTNKGLCGSLNTNLFRKIYHWCEVKNNYDFITLGIKGANFVIRSNYTLVADYSQELPFSKNTPGIIKTAVEGFLEKKYKEVVLCYNSFINALKIIPIQSTILPMVVMEQEENEEKKEALQEFLIEPSAKQLLNALLPHYLEVQVRNAIFQAEASEHSARMLAMKSATDNALSLSSELTLIYNKLRQEQITYEIADISRAQLSLN